MGTPKLLRWSMARIAEDIDRQKALSAATGRGRRIRPDHRETPRQPGPAGHNERLTREEGSKLTLLHVSALTRLAETGELIDCGAIETPAGIQTHSYRRGSLEAIRDRLLILEMFAHIPEATKRAELEALFGKD